MSQIAKPEILFFLGAGTSVKAGVPHTFGLVEYFREKIRDNSEKLTAVDGIIAILQDWKRQLGQKDERVDIELLLETLEKLETQKEDLTLQFYELSDYKLPASINATALKQELKDCINSVAYVKQDKINYLEPLLSFINEYRPLNVFTVNYDTSIEQFCNVYRKDYVDGFDVYWNKKSLERTDLDLRLYKLHGSIDWYRTDRGNYVKILIQPEKSEIDLIFGEKAQTLILYPMRKWEYAEPLLDIMMELKRHLEQAKFAFVIGYSFRDEHLTRIFWDAARKNKELVIILVSPSAHKIYKEKLRYLPSQTTAGNNANRIPSPLDGRVLCLPYKFEDIFPILRSQYFINLEVALRSENRERSKMYSGEGPEWKNPFPHYVACEFLPKVNSILDYITWEDLSGNNWEFRLGTSYKMFLTGFSTDDISTSNWFNRFLNAFDLFQTANFHADSDRAVQCFRLRIRINPQGSTIGPDGAYNILSQLEIFAERKIRNLPEEKSTKLKPVIQVLKELGVYFDAWIDPKMKFDKYMQLRQNEYGEQIKEIEAQLRPYLQTGDAGAKGRIEHLVGEIEQKEVMKTFGGLSLGAGSSIASAKSYFQNFQGE